MKLAFLLLLAVQSSIALISLHSITILDSKYQEVNIRSFELANQISDQSDKDLKPVNSTLETQFKIVGLYYFREGENMDVHINVEPQNFNEMIVQTEFPMSWGDKIKRVQLVFDRETYPNLFVFECDLKINLREFEKTQVKAFRRKLIFAEPYNKSKIEFDELLDMATDDKLVCLTSRTVKVGKEILTIEIRFEESDALAEVETK